MFRQRIVSFSVLGTLLLLVGFAATGLPAQEAGPQPEPAFRLTIEYKNGEFRLVQATPVEMVLPLTVKERLLAEGQRAEGYAFEMLDARRNKLVEGTIEDPTRLVAEWRDPEDPDRIRRAEVEQREITFTILVPAAAGARYLRLTGPDSDAEGVAPGAAPRRELGLFELP